MYRYVYIYRALLVDSIYTKFKFANSIQVSRTRVSLNRNHFSSHKNK